MIGFLSDLGSWFLHNWDGRGGYLWRTWEHLEVSGAAVLAAVVVAVPLASWLGHRGKGGGAAVWAVNLGRALPSFGIIALALPLTIRLADRLPFLDSGLGFLPTFIALFALALPPIFANTHAGVRSVDPETVEAARGIGLTGGQILRRIELPLAAPVVLAGLRTAAVQVIATATLGALVAYGGLGRYLVDGFALRDEVRIVAGALLVALLALAVEAAFALGQRRLVPAGARPRPRLPAG